MKRVESGHFVTLHYRGTLDNGDVFDSSEGCKPFVLQVGGGQVIKGFDEALIGMVMNEKKTFTLNASEGFGERDESLTQEFARSQLPQDFTPQVGEILVLENPQCGEFPATITDVNDQTIVVDLNHPLAGENLTFNVEILEISDQPGATSCGSCCSCT